MEMQPPYEPRFIVGPRPFGDLSSCSNSSLQREKNASSVLVSPRWVRLRPQLRRAPQDPGCGRLITEAGVSTLETDNHEETDGR